MLPCWPSRSPEALQAMLDVCSDGAQRRLLVFQSGKSRLMHLAGPELESLPVISLNGAPLTWVEDIRYLGAYITSRSKRFPSKAPYATQAVSGSLWALSQLVRSDSSLRCRSVRLLRLGILTVAHQQALYPTPVQDIDYEDLDVRVNDLLRRALRVPLDTHVAYLRCELSLWPSRFYAHARALQLAWRIRHQYWYSVGFDAIFNRFG
jgi:hypothetical protein